MNKVIAYISNLGQSIQFVAFCAHLFAAAYIVDRFNNKLLVASLITLYAAGKEFWFDAKYEKNPPQTFKDNIEDFLGYALGAWMAVLIK